MTRHARRLAAGDIIYGSGGRCHTITEYTAVPGGVITFRTDTGLDITDAWDDPGALYAILPLG